MFHAKTSRGQGAEGGSESGLLTYDFLVVFAYRFVSYYYHYGGRRHEGSIFSLAPIESGASMSKFSTTGWFFVLFFFLRSRLVFKRFFLFSFFSGNDGRMCIWDLRALGVAV